MVLFVLLVLAAVALGLIGAIVKGLVILLVIGIVLFAAALFLAVVRFRGADRRTRR